MSNENENIGRRGIGGKRALSPDDYGRTLSMLVTATLVEWGGGMRQERTLRERVGRACLLLPGSLDDTRRAAELVDRAVAAKAAVSDWIYPYFLFAKALAEYRQGRFDETITLLNGDAAKVLGPSPQLLRAMAEHRAGETGSARTSFAAAIASFDWRPAAADSRDVWLHHILRREAEATLRPNAPATRAAAAAGP